MKAKIIFQHPSCFPPSALPGISTQMSAWQPQPEDSSDKLEYNPRTWPRSGCGFDVSYTKNPTKFLPTVSGGSVHQGSLHRNLLLFLLIFSIGSLLHIQLLESFVASRGLSHTRKEEITTSNLRGAGCCYCSSRTSRISNAPSMLGKSLFLDESVE